MSWRDDLQRVTLPDGRILIGASFRGVPFFVESSERGGGRRAQVHEFPLRDDPYVEDLGRRARQFPLEGYVVGDGYVQQRDALLSALEDVAGPGKLVHPYYGVRQVLCTGYRVRETRTEGGFAVFSMELAEAPAQAVTPTVAPDLKAKTEASADVALVVVAEDFASTYSVAGQASWAVASLEAQVLNASEDLGAALSRVSMTTQELAAVATQTRLLGLRAASLVYAPADTMAGFLGAVRAVGEAAKDAPRAVLQALLDVYDGAAAELAPATTATRERERTNQQALGAALRRTAVIEAARMAARVTYQTHEDAVADRDAIAERLDAEALEASDAAYPSLVELRSALVQAVPGDAILARIMTVPRRLPVPSLLLSFQLYGSVDQEADLVARNGPAHPGFMVGDLKALSNG